MVPKAAALSPRCMATAILCSRWWCDRGSPVFSRRRLPSCDLVVNISNYTSQWELITITKSQEQRTLLYRVTVMDWEVLTISVAPHTEASTSYGHSFIYKKYECIWSLYYMCWDFTLSVSCSISVLRTTCKYAPRFYIASLSPSLALSLWLHNIPVPTAAHNVC